MGYTNQDLYSALLALLELGAATKPRVGEAGRVEPPIIPPLPAHIGFRLALCKNSLTPIGQAYEEALSNITQQRAEKASELEALKNKANREGNAEEFKRLNEELDSLSASFREEIRKLSSQEVDWSPPAKVLLPQLGDRQLPDAWLAALAKVGIIVDKTEEK